MCSDAGSRVIAVLFLSPDSIAAKLYRKSRICQTASSGGVWRGARFLAVFCLLGWFVVGGSGRLCVGDCSCIIKNESCPLNAEVSDDPARDFNRYSRARRGTLGL